jgi:hypothetical protein
MTEQKQPITDTQGTEANINKGRRRLSKAALATPVVASLAARPAMACSVSGFISGNTSPGHKYQCQGYGCTPGYWKEHPDLWYALTHGYASGGKQVITEPCLEANKNKCIFWSSEGGTSLSSKLGIFNPFGVNTAKPMLDLLDEYPGQPVFHFIGALLNAASSPDAYGSTVDELISGLVKADSLGKVHEYGQLLDTLNNRGCMFDSRGRCESGFEPGNIYIFSQNTETCIPKCKVGTKWDPVSMRCIPE